MSKNDMKPELMLWIHTHVRGSYCGFSSIDCHTQFAYKTISSEVLGLVAELDSEGLCKDYDFLELTDLGQNSVKKCGRSSNLSHIQHESCSEPGYFQSAKDKVIFSDELTLKVHDYRSVSSTENIQDSSPLHMRPSSSKTSSSPAFNWNSCKCCQKDFKNILCHLSKSTTCKTFYGDEFQLMKEFKEKERKAYQQQYKKENTEKLRKRKRDYDENNRGSQISKKRRYNLENQDIINEKQKRYDSEHTKQIRENQRVYNNSHQDQIKEKQRIFNNSHQGQINEKQRVYNNSHQDQIKEKQGDYNKIHRRSAL